MKIRYLNWRRVMWVATPLGVPAALFLLIQPNVGVWNPALEIAANVFICFFGGLGALVAFLTRFGVIQFVYSDADKTTWIYQIAKGLAERDRRGFFGSTFSPRYFESFGIGEEDHSDNRPA